MFTHQDQVAVATAYHRAVFRERQRSGVSWPFTRSSCVQDNGTINDTDVYDPKIVGSWTVDALGRFRVKLI